MYVGVKILLKMGYKKFSNLRNKVARFIDQGEIKLMVEWTWNIY